MSIWQNILRFHNMYLQLDNPEIKKHTKQGKEVNRNSFLSPYETQNLKQRTVYSKEGKT